MISFLHLFLILIALVIIVALAWRLASRRYTIPCPVWMKGLLDTPFNQGISRRTQETIERLALSPGMNVLDAGCGPGRLTLPMAEKISPWGEVTALDIQEGMLLEAQKRAREADLTNIHFLQLALGQGTIEHNYFDRAVLVTVFGEIPGREAALGEIYGSLKPGGILLVEETIRDPHFQTRGTVLKMANAAGFSEKKFFGNRFSYTLTLQKPSASGQR